MPSIGCGCYIRIGCAGGYQRNSAIGCIIAIANINLATIGRNNDLGGNGGIRGSGGGILCFIGVIVANMCLSIG